MGKFSGDTMARLLIKCLRPYHSYLWPHAKQRDQRWGDEWLLARLERDAGKGAFSVVKIESPDATIDLEANSNQPSNNDGAASPPEEAPKPVKRPRGRPRKNPVPEVSGGVQT